MTGAPRGGAARIARTAIRGGRSLPHPSRRRAFARELFFHAAKRFTPTLTVDSSGLRIQLSTSDHGVGKTLFMGDDVEQRTLETALGGLRDRGAAVPASGFVDVGANIGTTTLSALGLFGMAAAVCFEPEPENLRLLRQNVSANGMGDRVRIVEAALSDSEGTVDFEIAPDNPSDSRIRLGGEKVPDLFEEFSWRTHTVRTTTFDSQVREGVIDLGSTSLVWIDAQGHEGHIFAGANTLAGNGIPVVIEFWPYGLRRAGGMDLLAGFVGKSFSSIVDLATSSERDAGKLLDLETAYPDTAGTDLLLIP